MITEDILPSMQCWFCLHKQSCLIALGVLCSKLFHLGNLLDFGNVLGLKWVYCFLLYSFNKRQINCIFFSFKTEDFNLTYCFIVCSICAVMIKIFITHSIERWTIMLLSVSGSGTTRHILMKTTKNRHIYNWLPFRVNLIWKIVTFLLLFFWHFGHSFVCHSYYFKLFLLA